MQAFIRCWLLKSDIANEIFQLETRFIPFRIGSKLSKPFCQELVAENRLFTLAHFMQ